MQLVMDISTSYPFLSIDIFKQQIGMILAASLACVPCTKVKISLFTHQPSSALPYLQKVCSTTVQVKNKIQKCSGVRIICNSVSKKINEIMLELRDDSECHHNSLGTTSVISENINPHSHKIDEIFLIPERSLVIYKISTKNSFLKTKTFHSFFLFRVKSKKYSKKTTHFYKCSHITKFKT